MINVPVVSNGEAGEWYIRIRQDPLQVVTGKIMDATNSSAHVKLSTSPSWDPYPEGFAGASSRQRRLTRAKTPFDTFSTSRQLAAFAASSSASASPPLPQSTTSLPQPSTPSPEASYAWSVRLGMLPIDVEPTTSIHNGSQGNIGMCRQLCKLHEQCNAFSYQINQSHCVLRMCFDPNDATWDNAIG
ncbi:hypothetical protein CYMTET_29240 [Cymbomonas tetramitiformis]|uniref:Apple domain-containing protein n=1 Tax=Cymbomonas tetramitiformis TaxID=36881 RepID=A0AAE0FMW7_9CHLO|nr:hypothetical protein CYMTET_29240 [Cymbomonas tetramitiformis]